MVEQPEASRASPLRILLAHDLSAAADLAVGLIAHASWPASSVVRIVTSRRGVGPGMSSFANLREARIHAHQVREAIASTHERVAAELRGAGVATESRTVRGKPEQAIVAEADRFGANLLVVGARRQGSIAATLLGSVSRAVVERASCSVLVARSTAIRRILLATDGSPPARLATTIVGTWPMFAGARILLVGVSEGPQGAGDRDTVATPADRATSAVDEAIAVLAGRGRDVQADIRTGEAATEVVTAAREWPADLVVQGAYAKPLLHRLILGSVARKVLDGVTCSVLVARPGPTTDPGLSDAGVR